MSMAPGEAGRECSVDEGLAKLDLPQAEEFEDYMLPAVRKLLADNASLKPEARLAAARTLLREEENRVAGCLLDTCH